MSEEKCPECGTTGRVMPNGRLHVGGGIYHSKTACVAELKSQLATLTAELATVREERDAAVRERDVARRALDRVTAHIEMEIRQGDKDSAQANKDGNALYRTGEVEESAFYRGCRDAYQDMTARLRMLKRLAEAKEGASASDV